MEIYLGHSTNFDFGNQLYELIKDTHFAEQHNIVLPHEDSDELFDSYTFFKDNCDLFIAEVSRPSTGLGIELGWADELDVPIMCIHRQSTNPTGALVAVTDDENIHGYKNGEHLIEILEQELDNLS